MPPAFRPQEWIGQKHGPGKGMAGAASWTAHSLRRWLWSLRSIPNPARKRSLPSPARGLHLLSGRALETMPRRFDLCVCRSLASRPHLCGRGGVFRDVIPNDRTGGPMNQSGVLTGVRLRT